MPDDTPARSPGRVGQAKYFGNHAVRYYRRLQELQRNVGKYDALYVQRGLYPLGPKLVANPINRFPGRVVFDLDDNVFAVKPALAAKGPVARWLYAGQQAEVLARRANTIIVSTGRLEEFMPPGAGPSIVLPTVPNVADFHRRDDDRTRSVPVVGWAGTVGGLPYLDPLADVLGELQQDGFADFLVVCSQPWSGPARFEPWNLAHELSVFDSFDIGIMPLPDMPFTRGKAGFKLLQYMAAGLPVVASPVGVNKELVEQSGAGFLATTANEWRQALRLLLNSAGLRKEMGNAGRRFVGRYADLDEQGRTIASALRGEL